MLDKKLQGGKPDEDCYKLLKMMEKQAAQGLASPGANGSWKGYVLSLTLGNGSVTFSSAEQVNTASAEQVNTASAEQVSTVEGVNTSSIKLSTGDEQLSTGNEQVSTVGAKKS
ncbi:hypothetical protein Tco_0120545, partial [Tanacetum coccineum]